MDRVTSRVDPKTALPKMPPGKSLVKKEESVDLFLAFDDGIDWSQVSETQFDSQLDTQIQTQSQTQVETQNTVIGKPSPAKLVHSSVSPPVRTISVESGSSTQTNDSTRTIVVDDEDVDYRALLEGAENINWDDWDSDEENNAIKTPRKLKSPSKSKKFTPVKPKNLGGGAEGGGGIAITPPPYTKSCTRCIVVNTTKYDYLDDPVQVGWFYCPLSLSAGIKPTILSLDAWFKDPRYFVAVVTHTTPQKVIVKVAETEEHRLVVLRDVWRNTLLEKGTRFKKLVFTLSLNSSFRRRRQYHRGLGSFCCWDPRHNHQLQGKPPDPSPRLPHQRDVTLRRLSVPS